MLLVVQDRLLARISNVGVQNELYTVYKILYIKYFTAHVTC